jgi:hypothetical protein
VARAISGLFSKIQWDSWKFVDCGLILNKYRGFFVKWQEFSGFGIIFQREKVVDSVHGSVDRAGWPVHCSTVDSTVADGRGSLDLGLTVALGRDGFPRGWQRERGNMA